MSGSWTVDARDLPSKAVSVIFHPLFIPVYGLLMIFSAQSPFAYIPFGVKKLMFLIIVINNVMLPLASIPLLMQFNFVSSWSLPEREERAVPMIITTILYATTSYIIHRFPLPQFFKEYFFSVFMLSLILTIVNFRWKISLHSTGAGALTGTILYLTFRMSAPLLWFLVATIFVSGIVMSARLKLGLHTPAQVWGGFFTGLVCSVLFLWSFEQLV